MKEDFLKEEGIVLPADYIPTEEEEYMNPRHQEYFRQELMKARQRLLHTSQRIFSDFHQSEPRESDMIDRSSLENERLFDLQIWGRDRHLLTKIDLALRRLDQGDYGYCEETGKPIGIARLLVRPMATLCVEAQARRERKAKIGGTSLD